MGTYFFETQCTKLVVIRYFVIFAPMDRAKTTESNRAIWMLFAKVVELYRDFTKRQTTV